MKDLFSKSKRERHLFKSYYCAGCRQQKPCQLLTGWDSEWKSYCCPCYYQNEQARADEYSSYEKVLKSKQKEQGIRIKQYQLLKNYQGCRQCGSKEVDAYSLYENSQLVCQPCLMKKEGRSSSSISLTERQKWYKRYWKIDLGEWLERYSCLPVNADCAREWAKDRNHLNNCQCLEKEAQESYLLFSSSLREKGEKLKGCQCETSEKVRVSSDNFAWCDKCEESIPVASKKRVIKNRNDPRFWGLEVKERILCGDCLASKKEKMPPLRKAEFNRYRKVGRL